MPAPTLSILVSIGRFRLSLQGDNQRPNRFRLYHQYQDSSRRDGYLDFYRQTRNLRRTPLFILSTGDCLSSLARFIDVHRLSSGNAILVALIELMENYRNELSKKDLNPWYFLALLASIEVIVVLIALIWYLGKARRTF